MPAPSAAAAGGATGAGGDRPTSPRPTGKWVAVVASALCSAVLVGAPEAASTRRLAAQTAALEVAPGHPRLIIGGARGPSIQAVREACQHPHLAEACGRIGGRHVLDDAMQVLLTDDAGALGRARQALRAGVACGDGYEQTPLGGHALAYDWLYDRLSVADRRAIAEGLAACGSRIAGSLRGNAPHLWHGFTSQAAALALVALAVDDDDLAAAEVAQLRADAAELFRGRALEAYAVTGGAWPEGVNYLRSHFFSADPPYQYVIDALRAWDSAVVVDSERHASIFAAIRDEEGDWLRGLAMHVVYGSYPAYGSGGRMTLRRAGDMPTGQAWPNKQIRPFTDAIARATGDGALRAWGEALEADWPLDGGAGTYHSIHRYALPLDVPLDVPAEPLETLPLARIWSRADVGEVIARSGWGEDAVVMGYRAGAWFTGHQHLDQGHVDVWYRGPLALDAGVYANWGSEHRETYTMRSIAHNTLIIPKAGEAFDEHPALGDPVDDGGQRIPTYAGCPQCMQSVAEWRTNLGAGLHLEGGAIDAYEDGDSFTAIASELTGAYNSTRYASPGNAAKVERVQRDLTYLRPDVVLVVDRVITVGDAEAPRFVLHLPARPDIGPFRLVAGTATDGMLAGDGQLALVANGTGGHMAVRTLWPGATRITAVGGSGHRYWVDGANRDGGAAAHEQPPAEPGTWRIEVVPASGPGSPEATSHLLVHALAVGDAAAGVRERAAAMRVLDAAGDPVGGPTGMVVAIDDEARGTARIALRSRAVPRAPVRFVRFARAGVEPAQLVAADLVPGARYRMALGGRVVFDGLASAEGVLVALIRGAGTIALGACPALEGAGEAWAALCATMPPMSTATAIRTATPTATAGPDATPTAVATASASPRPTGHAIRLPFLAQP